MFVAAALYLTPIEGRAGQELWVYSSLYKEVAAAIEAAFEKRYPHIDVKTFQAGSEKLQAKIEAEQTAGRLQADILLTSDPFWGLVLDQRGLLLDRKDRKAVETNYYSLMVLVAHRNLDPSKRPTSFMDLQSPSFRGIVQMGSPLESGTTYSTVAHLSEKYGWKYFEQLRANGIAAAGGNSTVIQKVETGEKKVGIVLLENALAAIKRGSPLEVIYPQDGGILIPSVQMIFKDTRNKQAAELFADFMLGDEAQLIMTKGFIYSVLRHVPSPEGAKSLAEVMKDSPLWTPTFLVKAATESKDIKKKFSHLILE